MASFKWSNSISSSSLMPSVLSERRKFLINNQSSTCSPSRSSSEMAYSLSRNHVLINEQLQSVRHLGSGASEDASSSKKDEDYIDSYLNDMYSLGITSKLVQSQIPSSVGQGSKQKIIAQEGLQHHGKIDDGRESTHHLYGAADRSRWYIGCGNEKRGVAQSRKPHWDVDCMSEMHSEGKSSSHFDQQQSLQSFGNSIQSNVIVNVNKEKHIENWKLEHSLKSLSKSPLDNRQGTNLLPVPYQISGPPISGQPYVSQKKSVLPQFHKGVSNHDVREKPVSLGNYEFTDKSDNSLASKQYEEFWGSVRLKVSEDEAKYLDKQPQNQSLEHHLPLNRLHRRLSGSPEQCRSVNRSPVGQKSIHSRSPVRSRSVSRSPVRTRIFNHRSPERFGRHDCRSPVSLRRSDLRSPAISKGADLRSPVQPRKSDHRSPEQSRRSDQRSPERSRRYDHGSPERFGRSDHGSPESSRRLDHRFQERSRRFDYGYPKRSDNRSPVRSRRSVSRSPMRSRRSLSRSPLRFRRSLSRSPVSSKRTGISGGSMNVSQGCFRSSLTRSPVRSLRSANDSPERYRITMSRSPVTYRRSDSTSPRNFRSRFPDSMSPQQCENQSPERHCSSSPRNRCWSPKMHRKRSPGRYGPCSFGRCGSKSPSRSYQDTYDSSDPLITSPLSCKLIEALYLLRSAVSKTGTPYVLQVMQGNRQEDVFCMPYNLKKLKLTQKFELRLFVQPYSVAENWKDTLDYLIDFALESKYNLNINVEVRARGKSIKIKDTNPVELAEYFQGSDVFVTIMPEANTSPLPLAATSLDIYSPQGIAFVPELSTSSASLAASSRNVYSPQGVAFVPEPSASSVSLPATSLEVHSSEGDGFVPEHFTSSISLPTASHEESSPEGVGFVPEPSTSLVSMPATNSEVDSPPSYASEWNLKSAIIMVYRLAEKIPEPYKLRVNINRRRYMDTPLLKLQHKLHVKPKLFFSFTSKPNGGVSSGINVISHFWKACENITTDTYIITIKFGELEVFYHTSRHNYFVEKLQSGNFPIGFRLQRIGQKKKKNKGIKRKKRYNKARK